MRTILLLAFALAGASEITAPPPTLPEMASAEMQLSWQDFSRLLSLLSSESEKRLAAEKAQEDKPPIPWSISSERFTVDATSRGRVHVDLELGLQVLAKGWNKIPLIGDSIGLVSATLGAEPVSLAREGEKFWLLLQEPGNYMAHLEFYLPAPEENGSASFQFPVQSAPIMQMDLRLPAGDKLAGAANAAGWHMEKSEESQIFHIVYQPTEEIEVQWKRPVPPAPPQPVVPPRFIVQTETMLTLQDEFIQGRSFLDITVNTGEASGFKFTLAANLKLLEVQGEGAEWSSTPQDAVQEVTVNINHPVKDHYLVMVSFEAPIAVGESTFTFSPPNVLGAERNTGHTAVTTAATARVEAGVDKGATRIDASELPERMRNAAGHIILHAFQYTRPDHVLTLQVEKLQDVAVRIAGIEETQLMSIVTGDGMVITRAEFR